MPDQNLVPNESVVRGIGHMLSSAKMSRSLIGIDDLSPDAVPEWAKDQDAAVKFLNAILSVALDSEAKSYSRQWVKKVRSTPCKTHIFNIDVNGCVEYWAFAENQADALAVMVEAQGEWLEEPSDEITITKVSVEDAQKCMIRDDDGSGETPLYDIFLRDSDRTLVACTEW